ncbi:MAG TPA: methionyl-tRNA formyltransferase [Aquifex aeolicus]|nr:methionyl-tRNA formyltransferase [Aquifex aeolicus]
MKRILFMGTPQFAVPSLEELIKHFEVIGIVSQPDKPAGRGKKLTPPPTKVLAQKYGISVYQPEKKSELIPLVKDLNPECIVVVAYGKILPKEVLEVPPYGVINLHASLLPKYRGAAPIQRVLMAGEKETGNTVMLVNEEMDAGDILSQEVIKIEEEDNFYSLSEKLAKSGAKLLVKTLKEWFGGKIKPTSQNHKEATYAPPIQREELRICWNASAESVSGRIRGLYPNAYTFFRGNRIKILRAKVVDVEGYPGEIQDTKKFIVACGEKSLEILELISPKGKRMTGEEFMRGYRPQLFESLNLQ